MVEHQSVGFWILHLLIFISLFCVDLFTKLCNTIVTIGDKEMKLKFSMTATYKAMFDSAEKEMKAMGAVKVHDDGFNSKWVLGQVEYTIARAY